ncbi:MAG TPA: arginine deiminase-related protein, partial [Cytophagaceae bacterium]
QGVLEAVLEIKGVEGCEDMVFAANQTFPWVTRQGEKVVVMSKMRHASRQKEVPHFEKFFQELGYRPIHLNRTDLFEGMGDTIPHYGKWLLYGGFGHRSKKEAYEEIAELLQVPVVALELVDERFYHLDTCFVPVNENTIMICKEAFSADGLACIKKLFNKVIEIPVEEASDFFSLNAHLINDKASGKKVAILQKGSKRTIEVLKDAGYQVEEVDTSEYIKSGGSVFCMKMMLY